MAGVVVMVHRRNSVIHDGLGGKAAVAAVKQGKERASSNAVDLFGEGGKPKGPKWADVRKRLEDKGVLSDALFVSDQREKEIGEIVAEAEYQPLFTRLQETIRQNVLCIHPKLLTPSSSKSDSAPPPTLPFFPAPSFPCVGRNRRCSACMLAC